MSVEYLQYREGEAASVISQGHGYSQAGPDSRPQALAWLSLGLGLAQVARPNDIARLIGIPDAAESEALVRLIGLRELISGVGLLAQPNAKPWLWLRVAGDLMDLALLTKALGLPDNERERLMIALAALLGVSLLDLRSAMDTQSPPHRVLPGQVGQGVDVRHAITVNRPVEVIYQFWRNFENLPRFMRHLETVTITDGQRSQWVAKGPAGMRVEWEAELVTDRANEQIAWRSLAGASVPNAGSVRFRAAPGGRGTEVRVDLQYAPPGGKLGAAVASLFGAEPAQQVIDDLRRFKQVMETGEVVASDATLKTTHPFQPPAQPTNSAPPRDIRP
jgi:uncharacterized membrane protein